MKWRAFGDCLLLGAVQVLALGCLHVFNWYIENRSVD